MHWYVNPKTGNDADDGRNPAAAFKTLQHAVGVAAPGDTIVLAPGVYTQELPARIQSARAAKLNLTVAGIDG